MKKNQQMLKFNLAMLGTKVDSITFITNRTNLFTKCQILALIQNFDIGDAFINCVKK